MQQVFARSGCILFQNGVAEEDLDKLDPATIFQPGDRCTICSIQTGEAGVDGNGVIRLEAGLMLNVDTRIVELDPVFQPSGKVACRYECRVPARVSVEAM